MPYTIEDAMKAEIELLREMAKVEEKEKSPILAAMYKAQANSYQRCLNRLNGYDYSLEVVDGEIQRVHKKTDRKTLEEEYPALKKAAEEYDIVKNLVKNS